MYENEIKRTPDKFYFNMYESGALILSYAFTSEENAKNWERNFWEDAKRGGYADKIRPEITVKVEEAKGWEVEGRTFDDFNKALRYMWTECPGRVCIKGVF